MNTDSQAQQVLVGSTGGFPNYKNVKDSPLFTSIKFNDGRGDKAGEEDEEVATVNITVNEVISSEGAEGAAEVCPCLQSLSAFDSSRVSYAAATAV
jgi:hypothetical protein